MPRKGLNIHKRQDGRWEGRFKIGIYPGGATKYGSVYGNSYAEVKEKLVSVMANRGQPKRRYTEKSFSEVLRLWLDNNRLRQKGATVHKYRSMIERHIEPELGGLKASEITAVTVNHFLDRKLKSGRLNKKGGLSPSYVRTMSLIIQSALQFAASEEYCQPLKTPIHKPIAEKKDLRILSRSEQERLEGCRSDRSDTVCLGVLLSLYAGLRIGEVCALSWQDIDLNAMVIHVRHTVARVQSPDPGSDSRTTLIVDTPKTGASVRDIPISSMLLTRLAEYKQQSSHGFVLTNTADFVSPRTYEYRFHRLLDQCGIQRINYHALRHTFATRCIEAGVDVKSLSEMLGHANVGITLNTYVHPSMELKRIQLEKICG